MKPTVLYITYDGVLEPLGQSQVLAYLEQLNQDYDIRLISFEKKPDWADRDRRQAMEGRLTAQNITWIPLTYHRSPSAPATAYDIMVGTLVALYQCLRYPVAFIHVRSYVPALMALVVKKLKGTRFLFDIRGFWPDERVDGGLWQADSRKYKIAKNLERKFFLAATHVVTLTRASVKIIEGFDYLKNRLPPITVIPTCADLQRFSPLNTSKKDTGFVLGYVGSVGTWYLFDEVLCFYWAIRKHRPEARLLIVNRNEHEYLRTCLERAGVEPERFEIVAANHQDVPGLITRMTAGAAIIKPVYSKISSAPTKLAEYLGCGIPCIGNTNVGDMEEILEGEGVGVALTDFSAEDHTAGAERLLALLDDPQLKQRCVGTARNRFSLDIGVDAYREIYKKLVLPLQPGNVNNGWQ